MSLDKDRGELITYSNRKHSTTKIPADIILRILKKYGHQKKEDFLLIKFRFSFESFENYSTLEMKRSFKEGKAITMVRGSRNKGSPWAVACGFRYDGLYTIIGEKKRTNKVGGVYLCWKLKRNDNQGLRRDMTWRSDSVMWSP